MTTKSESASEALRRRQRIAHVLPWPTLGGVEQGTLRLASGLDRGRFESIAYCVRDGAQVAALFETHGISSALYPAVEPSFRRREYAVATVALARDLRQRGIDIVHCADLLAAFHVGAAARLAGCGLVCHVRCAYPQISWRDRLFLRPVQRWVFVSQATREEFAMRLPQGRSVVIPDAIEVARRREDSTEWEAALRQLGVPAEARIIGMVSRVAPIKDFETLARAVQQVARTEPRVHVIIVGDTSGTPSYRQHYAFVRTMLAELGVDGYFTFTGHRPDVRTLMSAFEIVALVTHSEGLPLVLLEAMAMGKPVVATAVGGIPEVVRHGETGLLHERGNADDLAAAFLAMFSNAPLRSYCSAAAQRMICEEFNGTRFYTALESVYEEIVAGRRRTRSVGTGGVTSVGGRSGAGH